MSEIHLFKVSAKIKTNQHKSNKTRRSNVDADSFLFQSLKNHLRFRCLLHVL